MSAMKEHLQKQIEEAREMMILVSCLAQYAMRAEDRQRSELLQRGVERWSDAAMRLESEELLAHLLEATDKASSAHEQQFLSYVISEFVKVGRDPEPDLGRWRDFVDEAFEQDGIVLELYIKIRIFLDKWD